MIPQETKLDVINLYVGGASYDRIISETGVSKGSIINIVESLRRGDLPDPHDLGESVDAFRRLSRDLREHDIGVVEAAAGTSVYRKLQELGVEPRELEEFTNLVRELASESNRDPVEFISAAFNLRELEASTGNYQDILHDWKEKQGELEETNAEIKEKQELLGEIESTITDQGLTLEEATRILGRIPGVEDEIKRLKNTVKGLREDKKHLTGVVKALNGEEQKLDRRIKEKRESHSRWTDDVFNAQHTLQTIYQQTNQLTTTRDQLTKECGNLEEVIAELAKLRVETMRLEERRERLKEEIEDLEEEKKNVQNEINRKKLLHYLD